MPAPPTRPRPLPLACLAAVALLGAWAARPLAATTYTVLTTADGAMVDGDCTLREAIRAAATDAAVDLCPAGGAADLIVLAAAGTYAFDLGEEVTADDEITIEGATAVSASHVIDLGGANRFLRATAGSRLTLSRLTLANGNSLAAPNPEGGCLRVDHSHLTLRDAVISGCLGHRGGGVWFLSSTATQALIERVAFVDNEARGAPGMPGADGGGAFVGFFGNGTAVVSDSVFLGNRAVAQPFGGTTGGSGLKLFANSDSAQFTLRRLQLEENEEDSFNGGFGALQVISAGGEQIVIEDLLIAGNASVGDSSSSSPVGLGLLLFGGASVEAARVRLLDNTTPSGIGVHVAVAAQGTATLTLRSLLLAAGPDRGLTLQIADAARVLAGHLTVVGHAERGVLLENASTGPLRLENSLLWGNGPGGSDDLAIAGVVDADRAANHNWIGSLGDPDPQLVDPAGGDFDPQPGSPLVDAGDRTFLSVGGADALGRPRVVGGETDIGALEEPGVLFADGFESGDTGAWSQVAP